MSYAPVIPTGGNAGWTFLQRTREAQQTAFNSSGRIPRDTDYFEANISKVKTAGDLMDDRRLLRVALGAFGLSEDISNKFFIRKVLEEGTLDKESLANKLSDKRYLAFSRAFGFDLTPPRTQVSTFGAQITASYRERQFEVAVGEQDANMRFALGFDRELASALKNGGSDDANWFTVMATRPLRAVFEGAFALPTAFGTLDVDRQLQTFKAKAEAVFGDDSVAQFTDPAKREELTRLFLVRADLQSTNAATSSSSVALTLLQAMPQPPSLLG